MEVLIEKKHKELIKRLVELERLLASPKTLKPKELQRLQREYKELSLIKNKFSEYEKISTEIRQTKELLATSQEPEFVQLLKEEESKLEKKASSLKAELLLALSERSPAENKNCIVEIRAAAGGSESALFVADLFRMYTHYITEDDGNYEVLSSRPSDLGGFKEIIFLVQSANAYRKFRFESGVHRVQRIPKTEASGRIHTSTVTVAVLPEAEEVDLKINEPDLKIEVFRARGHGGQHVNVTDSAVRITHIPSGISVSCQDERSQYQNRVKALKILRSRLLAIKRRETEAKTAKERREQVGTGERSEKIRTYNFPQNRITDHRLNRSFFNLKEILDGKLEPLINELEEWSKKGNGK